MEFVKNKVKEILDDQSFVLSQMDGVEFWLVITHYVICPYPYSSLDQFLSHDDIFPLSLLIHLFP